MRIMAALRTLFSKSDIINVSVNPSIDAENMAVLLDYYQQIAAGIIGRSLSQITFVFVDNGETVEGANYAKWNIRPNCNESGAEFKAHLGRVLAINGEALIIVNYSNDLLIADSYSREEHANIPDEFSNVLVKDYTYTGKYYAGKNCIYIKVRNTEQDILRDTIYNIYGKIIAHTVQSYMAGYSQHLKAKINTTATSDDERLKQLQSYIDKQSRAFFSAGKSTLVEQNGVEYSEFSSREATVSEDAINKQRESAVKMMAEAYGIPLIMLTGDTTANINSNEIMDEYINNCLAGYCEMIAGAVTVSTYNGNDPGKYCTLNPNDARTYDMISNADKLDKAASCGVYTIDEVRKVTGHGHLPDGKGTERLLTKNYAYINIDEEKQKGEAA